MFFTAEYKTLCAIHSTKNSGNFGPKLNESVQSNRKSVEKTGPPIEVDHFSRADRSDRKMTVPFDHSNSFSSQCLTVPYIVDVLYPSKNGGFSLSVQLL